MTKVYAIAYIYIDEVYGKIVISFLLNYEILKNFIRGGGRGQLLKCRKRHYCVVYNFEGLV